MERRNPAEGRARGRGRPLDPSTVRGPGERPQGLMRPGMQQPARPQTWGQPIQQQQGPPRPQAWEQAQQGPSGGGMPPRPGGPPPNVAMRPSGPSADGDRGRGRAPGGGAPGRAHGNGEFHFISRTNFLICFTFLSFQVETAMVTVMQIVVQCAADV
jgi:translation initiation factor IF-2